MRRVTRWCRLEWESVWVEFEFVDPDDDGLGTLARV